ncbi:MAG: PhoH family protein [bacterium]|nr:PhoH family protein [bacterium]
MAKKKRIYVLDTNVILHDHECIYGFANNDVVIPITVLEELDNFKKGHDQLNYNARQFIRVLDKLAGEKLVSNGVRIATGKGKIFIFIEHLKDSRVSDVFTDNKADHRILSVALNLSEKNKDRDVIMVSKDVNLRLKAKSLGITSEDYSTDRIQDINTLYKGKREIENVENETLDRLLDEPEGIAPSEVGLNDLYPHEYFILRNSRRSRLAYYNPQLDRIQNIAKPKAYGITPRNAEQCFALHALMNPEIQLVTLSGKAGTGKTLLALAGALEVRTEFQQIYLGRPIVPLSNRDMGYLPGDIEKKLEPYMQPLYDNLTVIKNQFSTSDKEYKRLAKMEDTEKLYISPLSYIRGRSLERIFFIVDEAQNLTPHEVKTIITRAGEGTKVVFTGDPYQIDTPYLDAHSTGLSYLVDRMKGQDIYAHVTLEKGERSKLAELASDLL